MITATMEKAKEKDRSSEYKKGSKFYKATEKALELQMSHKMFEFIQYPGGY